METPELLLRFTRGQLPLGALSAAGIQVEVRSDQAIVHAPNSCMIVPELTDVAAGFLNHRFTEHLREWATVLLAASSCIDLASLESGPTGELLLQALWDISAGKDLPECDWNVIAMLA
jgi:hypothetical protein